VGWPWPSPPSVPTSLLCAYPVLHSNFQLAPLGTDVKQPRTEVTKKIWEYIKANTLQDAANKRNINADAKLKPIFGKDQVTMFEMTKLLSAHLR
jgi:chromatin remodeling complex protein RSC6